MYKLADEHLTTLTENLHKVIEDACKTYVEDAIVRFKEEVYKLFDPEVGNDKAPTEYNALFYPGEAFKNFTISTGTTQNKNLVKSGPFADSIPNLQAGEKPIITSLPTNDANINICIVKVVTNLGNMYWKKWQSQDSYLYITSGQHITNTPLSPLFLTIVKNAMQSPHLDNILDMNRKYYYLLAKDSGAEIVRREKDLAQKAAERDEIARDFERKYGEEYEKRRAAEAELAALKEKMRALCG